MKTLLDIEQDVVAGADGATACTYAGMAAGAVAGPVAGAAVAAACMSLPGMDGGVGTYNSAAGSGPRGTQQLDQTDYVAA